MDDKQKNKAKFKDFFPLFLGIFIDLLGFGIILPVLGVIFLDPVKSIFDVSVSFQARSIFLGLLLAVYPLAQFFGAPILGALSDRYGRKKILMFAIIGTAFPLALFAVGIWIKSLPLMFFARIIDGFTGGKLSVAQSAISDMSTSKTKARNFGLIGIAFGLGFILGPVFGGKLSDPSISSYFTLASPFWFASLLSIINAILLGFWFRETNFERRKTNVSFLTGFKNISKAWQMKNMRNVFLVMFFYMFGFSFFAQFFQVFLIEKFNFNEGNIGTIFGYIGILIVISQVVLTRPLSKIYTPEKILSVVPLVLGFSFLILLIPNTVLGVYMALILIAFTNGLTLPNATALVSSQGGSDSQGEVLGINQSVTAIAQAIPPVIAGIIASISVSMPIIVASGATMIAWFIFFFRFRKTKKEVFHEV